MKRKTAPQIEWERLKPQGHYDFHRGAFAGYRTRNQPRTVRLNYRQFNRLWQLAYRRGMERAAGVALAASEKSSWLADGDSPSAAWHKGRNAASDRIRRFIEEGAKDE